MFLRLWAVWIQRGAGDRHLKEFADVVRFFSNPISPLPTPFLRSCPLGVGVAQAGVLRGGAGAGEPGRYLSGSDPLCRAGCRPVGRAQAEWVAIWLAFYPRV